LEVTAGDASAHNQETCTNSNNKVSLSTGTLYIYGGLSLAKLAQVDSSTSSCTPVVTNAEADLTTGSRVSKGLWGTHF